MRSTEEMVERLLCAEHCRFFRPWERDHVYCGAHRWLLDRARTREDTIDVLEKIRGTQPAPGLRHDADLQRTVCRPCPFYRERCRFRASQGKKGKPCGGVVALALLLERELVSVEELYASP